MSADALHESAHAVVAHRLGVIVVHAIAEGDNPHVRTRSPWGSDATKVETLQRQAIIDLAGAAMRFRGRWLWAHEVRNDPAIAAAFIKDRADDAYPESDRDTAMLRAWLAPQKGARQ